MNNRQARIFAIACTGVATLVFLALTLDSHRQFPELTHAKNITPEVTRGKDVWHKYNCINCHTLFGEGAYYAPDLTKITDHRGEAYLKAYMRAPEDFYDEQKHRRLMPNQNLEDGEIDDLIAFFQWVANVDNQGWPPRPILVTGSYVPGTDTIGTEDDGDGTKKRTGTRPVTAEDDARAQGESLYRSVTPACNACHSTAPGADMAGPSLAGVVSRAEAIVNSSEYTGDAEDVEAFIRESIVEPSAYVTPGSQYSADGTSFMPNSYTESLTDEQIDQLVAYLTTLK